MHNLQTMTSVTIGHIVDVALFQVSYDRSIVAAIGIIDDA